MVQQNDNTTLDPSSDTLRALVVKWIFLGGCESPFLHCSKDLQTVKEQAWNMGGYHVIVRVQIGDALDRDDVIDMSTHDAQIKFFGRLHRFRNVNNFEDIFCACYNNLLLNFDLKSTWEEALRNGVNEKVVLLKWRGFVPLSGMTVIYETSSSGWKKVFGENIVEWLTRSFWRRHVLNMLNEDLCIEHVLLKYRKRMEHDHLHLLSVDFLECIDARRVEENAAASFGSQPHVTSVPEEARGARGSAAQEPEEPRASAHAWRVSYSSLLGAF